MKPTLPPILRAFVFSGLSAGALLILSLPRVSGEEPEGRLRVKISWGHERTVQAAWWVRLAGQGVEVDDPRPLDFEPGDAFPAGGFEKEGCQTQAGAGDVDGIEFMLVFPRRPVAPIEKPHSIWSYLLEHSDPDTARRLRQDPGMRPDPRRLAVDLDPEGTRGFSLTVDQLERLRTFWARDLDIFIAAGNPPSTFEEHRRELRPLDGRRILDQVQSGPEASYEQFKALWEDMGSPAYRNPHQTGPGHIVCLAWESSIHKFGIDRGAGVWNDYGNPDRFRFWLDAGDFSGDLARAWKWQRLSSGLPVVTTCLERDGVRYEIEQFAYPLNGPPPERRGDIPMTLCQKLTLTEIEGRSRTLRIGMTHQRDLPGGEGALDPGKAPIEHVGAGEHTAAGGALVWETVPSRHALLAIQGKGISLASESVQGSKPRTAAVALSLSIAISLEMASRETRELFIKIPSPPVQPADRGKLLALDHSSAREAALRFWRDWLSRGALFEVPEEAVNDLFRANLWHALRLPRRHGGTGEGTRIDLPYSNFAYDQSGTPWPVNQAVYVDSMIHDLRGHHDLSAEELSAMYRGNQEPDGHVKGFAGWGVYTPGMIYATARHFLLSGDRDSFENLLGPTLRALDWCLARMRRASERSEPARGLVLAPLNDLSHDERAWAFNQAYYFAGADLLARALGEIGHPRAAECAEAARAIRKATEREYGRAAASAPLVQLRDGTWIPYVPGDALSPRRLLEIWYPTDVDTGPLHLARLGALDPEGLLTACLLNDHEDNLFLGGLGMANEPVYNPQATAYLLRDDAKAAIRAFYSMMACAFSHSALEPVEHRWAWGQYFGPPSTDGAWFELYRHMLIREQEGGSLLLLQATPRKWLEDGKRIRVERAPTFHGAISFSVESRSAAGEIEATVDVPRRKRPACLLVRLRHPSGLPLRAAAVNGERWKDCDARKEWIRIADPVLDRYSIVARY